VRSTKRQQSRSRGKAANAARHDNPRVAAIAANATYRDLTAYGPFFRLANDLTQTPETMREILRSGELWGRPGMNSDIPAAKAYPGELPTGKDGFEFFTEVRPHTVFASGAFWRVQPDGSVWGDNEWAKVKVLVSRVSQEF
jgi:hypothetical protein